MSAKPIREFDGKRLLNEWLQVPLQAVLITPETDLSFVVQSEPWLATTRLVVKPDQLMKRRGKGGLVGLDLSWEDAVQWITSKRGTEIKIGNAVGVLEYFLVEPFLPHSQSDEYYVCITPIREGEEILFYHEGGVDVGDVDAKASRMFIPMGNNPTIDDVSRQLLTNVPHHRRSIVAEYIASMFQCYSNLNFTYMEINPLTVIEDAEGTKVIPLDMAAKLDETAHFEMADSWGDITFPSPFGAVSTPEEKFIASLDNKTGSSLKLTVLNPNGRIWTMVAGGGASVIYADTVVDFGFAHELANYGEYSGAPNEAMTYSYAKTLLDLMTRAKRPEGKVLLIGGGIANFTNVAETFKGIIKALREFADKLRETDVKIFVRRGGPNYQEGLRLMKECADKNRLDMQVFGPETHITAIVGMALGRTSAPQTLPELGTSPAASSPHSQFMKASGMAPTPFTVQPGLPERSTSDANEQSTPSGPDLINPKTTAIVYGLQTGAVQNMLDFDYVCRRESPSVSCIVYTFSSSVHHRQFYWGDKEIMMPVYPSLEAALEKFPKVSVVVNFASSRSAYESTVHMLNFPQLRLITIIAEGVPERLTRTLISSAREKGVTIIGPATVGGVKAGCLRIGNSGGMLDNIVQCKLHRPGSVAYVSRSGGLSNELNNIISRTTDGVFEGIAIGGDRYPITTFVDHLVRFDREPGVKILVLLGEVGGTLEHQVCEALKNKQITKPLIAWCSGTCASAFSYDVQFGHAGALAQSQLETAKAKNAALREAGAIVPDSFDSFADCISDVYKHLVEMGTITPCKEISPPPIPVEYSWARKLGLIRKPTLFVSSICDERGDDVCYSGITLSSCLEKDVGIGGVLSLLWLRRMLPPYGCKFIEIVLMITADHGPAVSGAHNTIVATRAGKDLISSVVSGLLCIGPRFGGALDEAGINFSWAKYEGPPEKNGQGMTPHEFVAYMRDVKKEHIAGIGHRIKSIDNPDKRVQMIVQFAKKHFAKTELLDYALEVEKVTTRKRANLILNVDGALACAFIDLLKSCGLFTPAEVSEYIENGALNGLFVLGRSIGFIGHHLDQKRLRQELYRQPHEDISYIVDSHDA